MHLEGSDDDDEFLCKKNKSELCIGNYLFLSLYFTMGNDEI